MGRLLYDELVEKNEELARIFDRIYEYSREIWSRPLLLRFTEHGELHTKQVEKNLDSLTRPVQRLGKPPNGEDELRGALIPEEIFILLSACCLHDIGMQYDDELARQYHAEYSCNLIAASSVWEDPELRKITLPINDTIAREAIARVARAHWFSFAREPHLKEKGFICNYNVEGRLQLLGTLLAMADLLDQSNARARYFHTSYRLLKLDATAELHTQKHERVQGLKISPKNPKIPGELQFQLTWQDSSDDTQDISEWLTVWLNSQWQAIQADLEVQSSGEIRWARPWLDVKFGTPFREFKALPRGVRNVLRAERAEQTRVDRDEFIGRFRQALGTRRRALFRFPSDWEMDGVFVSRWCAAQANAREEFAEVAEIVVGGKPYTELPGIISDLMKKWQPGLRVKGNERGALNQLRSFLSAEERSLISIISTSTDRYKPDLLSKLLAALMLRPRTTPPVARICLLLTPGAEGPQFLSGAQVYRFDKAPLTRRDVELHLQTHWGYNDAESQRIARGLSDLGHLQEPGMVYSNIEKICGLLSGSD